MEHLQLDFAHDLNVDLIALIQQMQLGIFLLQQPQLGNHLGGIPAGRQLHPVGHHRLCSGSSGGFLAAQSLACPGFRQAGDRDDLPREGFLRGGEFITGVQPQLRDFFFLFFPGAVNITQ